MRSVSEVERLLNNKGSRVNFTHIWIQPNKKIVKMNMDWYVSPSVYVLLKRDKNKTMTC